MAEFLALLCWWVAMGCGETATHIWDFPKGEAVVISQEVQSATGTLMERPAPILGANFCKRSEYAPNCWEWAPNGDRQGQIAESVVLSGGRQWQWRIRGSGYDGWRCSGAVGGKRFSLRDVGAISAEVYDSEGETDGWYDLRADYLGSDNGVWVTTDTYRCRALALEFREL